MPPDDCAEEIASTITTIPIEPAILNNELCEEDVSVNKEGVDLQHMEAASNSCCPSTRKNEDDANNADFLVQRTAALCICMLTHSYLLISVFPYSGFLAMHLLHLRGDSEDSVGPYAGFIAASFMAGRAVTAFAWGRIADRYGRLFVLYFSLGLSAILSVLFGLASHSFVAALSIRFLLGCSNGIVSAVKTLASEISDHDSEAKVMNIVLGMWGLGFLISPAISGLLAEPVRQYPDRDWDNVIGETLTEFPFILPNLVGAFSCLFSLVLVTSLPETLPSDRRKHILHDLALLSRRCFPTFSTYQIVTPNDAPTTTLDLDVPTNDNIQAKADENASMFAMFADPEIRRCMLINWAFSFVALTVDESFPLFCLSHKAGFGISEKEIGKVLSTCGLFFVVFQYWVYDWLHRRFGIYGSIKASLFVTAPVLFLMPLSILLNAGTATGNLNWATFLFMASMLAIFRCCSGAFYTSVSVAANRSVTASNRAALNGLTMLGGSITKGLGPAMSGLLVSSSVWMFGSSAGICVFWTIATINVIVFALALFYFPSNETLEVACNEESKMEMVHLETKASP